MSGKFCPAMLEKGEHVPCNCPGDACTLHEFRALRADGGRERAQALYLEALRKRAGQREQGDTPADTAHRMQRLGVPSECLLALRGDLQDKPALEAAKRFVRAPKETGIRYLCLPGPVGCGKTVAAAYVVQDACRRVRWNDMPSGEGVPEPILFARAGELTRLGAWDKSDTAWLKRMRLARLLVLDDLGDEGGPVARGALAELVLSRDVDGRRTVLTSNLVFEEFARLYGAPLMDRLKARGIIPNLGGQKSMRRATKAEVREEPGADG